MSSKNQPSRKGKKAWRRNVDISDVTTGLEEVREQITQGGVIAEKANETLFSLDLGGSTAITKKEKLGPRLKSDEILAARSAVPGVSAKRRNNDAIGSGIYERKKKRIDGVSHAHLQRLRMTAYGKSSAPVKNTSNAPNFDPWDEDVVPAPVDPKQSFLEFIPPPKPPTTMKHEPISLSTSVKMPAVRVPDAGISYNPEFAKWDALLREEGEKEVEHEKARLAGLAEEARIQILREESDVESAAEDSESEEEESVQSGDERVPVDQSRKTQTQRNKEARAKAQERERMEARKQKIAERELLLIKKHAKDVKAQERIRMARLMEKMTQKPDDEKNPKIMRKKRFGKIPLPRAPLEVQLPDELAESLRLLKPEGNLLSDRFRSMRERGLVEARAPIVEHKKKKISVTEKWSYKDFV